MKHQIFVIALYASVLLDAQSQKETGNEFFNQLTADALILSEDGLIRGTKKINAFVAEFVKSNRNTKAYKKQFSIPVNAQLAYEIGEIQAIENVFSVMFLRRKGTKAGSSIELLVIYKKVDAEDPLAAINRSRTQWMELCNAHKAAELVKELYTSNAFYYNRGRLLQGTKTISAEYGYMNSPAYSLKLTPKHVAGITPTIAFEIGRCSGSYPNPYMLLWEKQADGKWQVLMDSND